MEIKTKHKKTKTKTLGQHKLFPSLKALASSHQIDIEIAREIAETYHELNHFDDEDGTLSAQLEEIDATSEIKEEIQQLVASRLQ